MHPLGKFLLGCITALLLSPSFADLQQDIASLPEAHVGMVVMDPQTGKILYQYQAEQYFHPASTTKLFTAIAAMLSLGPDYQFTTTLSTDQNNVYLQFSGDPSLTSQDLMNVLAVLQQQGIRNIKGNVVLDNTLFPANLYALGHFREDGMWAYGLAATTINIDENRLWVGFKAGTPKPVITTIKPALIQVQSQLVWQNANNKKICAFQAVPSANSLILQGCLPAIAGINLALPDPNAYAMALVQQDLKTLGIQVQGKIVFGKTPVTAQALTRHSSLPLSNLLTWMLQTSDNLYASAITKTMGLKRYNIGGEKAGTAAIQSYLAAYQLPFYILEDGSGNSYDNLVTPLVMAELLYHANQNPMLAAFLKASLPKMQAGHIYAKPGSLTNVLTLAGFIHTVSNKNLIFSLLLDNTPLSNAQLTAFQNKILRDLYANT